MKYNFIMKSINSKLLSFIALTITVIVILGYYQFINHKVSDEKIKKDLVDKVVVSDQIEEKKSKVTQKTKINEYSIPEVDIIRVKPSGEFLIAGSAKPKSKINLNNNGKILLSTDVDEKGNWVLVSEKPFKDGDQMLIIDQVNHDGTKISSKEVIVTKISKNKNLKPIVFALPNEDGGILKVIQKSKMKIEKVASGKTSLSISDSKKGVSSGSGFKVLGIFFDEIGRVSITGIANYGNAIEILINGKKEKPYLLNSNKEWTIKSKQNLTFGQHLLTANLLDVNGSLLKKITFPFLRAEIPKGVSAEDYVIIKPGDMLWTISYRVYGNPWKYVEIFDENKDQISNPDLIFPGQIFTLPN